MLLTPAEVAAVINVALIVLQLSHPMLIAFMATGMLKDRVNASTWSVFGALVNQSLWSWIFGSDTSSTRRVDRRISALSYCAKAAAIVAAIAAATTPLGIRTGYQWTYLEDAKFMYLHDSSLLKRGTMSRDTYTTDRLCAYGVCPGNVDGNHYVNTHGEHALLNDTNPYTSTEVASTVFDVFTSGTIGGTIASIFDIQYRIFSNFNDDNSTWWSVMVDNGRSRTQGRFRYYKQYLLEPKIQAITGLVLSTTDSPGIGFRNHTAPATPSTDYKWTEDILWLEPETKCTDLNITYEYTMPRNSHVEDIMLMDQGGFISALNTHGTIQLDDDAQSDPALLQRSRYGAVLTNQWLAHAMNITPQNAFIGKSYSLKKGGRNGSDFDPTPNRIVTDTFGSFGFPSSAPSSMQVSDPGFTRISQRVTGIDILKTTQHMSNVAISGSILTGVGRQMINGTFASVETANLIPGSKVSHALYSCVSAVKASVKVVRFRLNGEASLDNLIVDSVEPSTYDPLWAVEDTGWVITEIDPLWGIISDMFADRPGLSVLRRSHLYLPSSASPSESWTSSLDEVSDAVAGASGPGRVFMNIYDALGMYPLFKEDQPDYTGQSSWPMYSKWYELCQDASTVSQIPNLIWTDLMANYVVGTKNILSQTGKDSAEYPAQRRIEINTYQWRYASAAIFFAAIYLVLILAVVILYTTGRCNLAMLRFMLDQSAAGRSMTTERFEGSSEADFASNKQWALDRGDEILLLGKLDVEK